MMAPGQPMMAPGQPMMAPGQPMMAPGQPMMYAYPQAPQQQPQYMMSHPVGQQHFQDPMAQPLMMAQPELNTTPNSNLNDSIPDKQI